MASAFDTAILSLTSTTGIYWGLEDNAGTSNATDLSGNGHALSTSNFTFGSAGIVPSDALTCATLSGSSNASSAFAPSFSGVTAGCIVMFPSFGSNFPNFLTNFGSNAGLELIFTASTAIYQVGVGNGTSSQFPSSPTALIAGHSYLLSMTWNGTTVTLYQYDLTAKTSITPQTAALSGTFTSPNGWTVGNFNGGYSMGRIFVLPTSISTAQMNALATAANTLPVFIYAPTMGWQAVLNKLAGTTNLGELAAANAYAGTKNLGLLAALNAYAGTKNLGLNAVCNNIAGTKGLEALNALNQKAGV